MTLLEKAKQDGKRLYSWLECAIECPCTHGYESREESAAFCDGHNCEECYAREYKGHTEEPQKAITRESILQGAIECTCTDRNHQYGGPERSFAAIAEMWTAYMHCKGHDITITAHDAAMMLTLFKAARVTTSETPKADTYTDMAGYAACAGEIACAGGVDEKTVG